MGSNLSAMNMPGVPRYVVMCTEDGSKGEINAYQMLGYLKYTPKFLNTPSQNNTMSW